MGAGHHLSPARVRGRGKRDKEPVDVEGQVGQSHFSVHFNQPLVLSLKKKCVPTIFSR